MVFEERDVDLRQDDRQTKELRRIADRVRKIALRDFQEPIAVIVVADQENEPIVKIGTAVAEEVIEDGAALTEKYYAENEGGEVMFDPLREVSDEEALAGLEASDTEGST